MAANSHLSVVKSSSGVKARSDPSIWELAVPLTSAVCFLLAAALVIYHEFTGDVGQNMVLHMALYGCIRAMTHGQVERVLHKRSMIFSSLIPAAKRTETVAQATQFLTCFFWLPANLVAVYRVFHFGTMEKVRNHSGLVSLGSYVLLIDTVLDMSRPSGWQLYMHHIAMIGLCVASGDWGCPDLGQTMLCLQSTMDRAATSVFFIHRMALHRDKHRMRVFSDSLSGSLSASETTERSDSSASTTSTDGMSFRSAESGRDLSGSEANHGGAPAKQFPPSIPTDRCKTASGIKRGDHRDPILESIDNHLCIQSTDPLPTTSGSCGLLDAWIPSARTVSQIGTLVFIFYVFITRFVTVAAISAYCYYFWPEMSSTWKTIHPFGMVFFIMIDIDVYQILWRRSTFCATVRQGLQNTVYQPGEKEMNALKEAVTRSCPKIHNSKLSRKR